MSAFLENWERETPVVKRATSIDVLYYIHTCLLVRVSITTSNSTSPVLLISPPSAVNNSNNVEQDYTTRYEAVGRTFNDVMLHTHRMLSMLALCLKWYIFQAAHDSLIRLSCTELFNAGRNGLYNCDGNSARRRGFKTPAISQAAKAQSTIQLTVFVAGLNLFIKNFIKNVY